MSTRLNGIYVDLIWRQALGGGTETMERGIPAERGLDALQRAAEAAQRGEYGMGAIVYLVPSDDPIVAVERELARARELHAAYNSAHEAYAVILEELDEFWDEVRKRRAERDPAAMRAELIQLAATAIRAIEDLKL